MAVRNQTPTTLADNTITILPEDWQHGTLAEDAPFVISARIGTGLVRRILVDTDGSITLPITIGTGNQRKTILSEFVVLKDSTAYNVILGRKTINDFSAVIFTKYLLMKFTTDNGSIGTIHGDREVAVECDNTSLALRKKSRDAAGIFLADLDPRQDGQPRPEPEGDMEKLQIGPTKEEYTFINRNLPEDLSQLLKQNRDLFAFTPADMPGINLDLMSYRLAVGPKAKHIAQKRRKMSPDRAAEVKKQVKALLEANFIRELPYTTWLANVVLMRLNPTKCAFGMEAGKFLGFMITQRGVEANPEKCRAILEMTNPKNLNDIQKLTGWLTVLSRFLGASAQKALPFFKLMKKGGPFNWEAKCEEAFQHFKRVLAEPPVLAKPQTGETLYLYLSITE
ncbi:uncharacterized protein [Arachis hypogaea]|uniref:uncharacterized protein n=1 Tax=Arachis hypogaea TaxID=3818 RepID=UPI003B21B96E